MDDFHVAYKCVGDLGTKSLSEAYGILAVKNNLGDFWFRSNCLSNIVGLGTTQKLTDSAKLSAELQYDVKDGKVKGVRGLPLFLRAGLSMNLANKSKLSLNFFFKDSLYLTAKQVFPVNANTVVTVSEQATISTLKGGLNPSYKLGFALEFKL